MKTVITYIDKSIGKYQRENLRILMEYLKTKNPEAVRDSEGSEDPRVEPVFFNLDRWHCGSTACAVGHGMYCKELQERGLGVKSLNEGNLPRVYINGDWKVMPKNSCDSPHEVLDGWPAASEFFVGPTQFSRPRLRATVIFDGEECVEQNEVADWLFAPSSYPRSLGTPANVAERIRLVLEALEAK